jgi:hypothetical protein
MRKRKYLIGATLAVAGALVVSGTAYAGAPTGQTLTATVAPSKLQKKTFSGVSLHNIIATTYSDFSASPAAKETKFTLDKQIKFVNGNLPACPQSTLNAASTAAAIQAACARSIVGVGSDEVNNKTGLFPNPNPVLLVSGGPTSGGSILYVWTRINNALTLVLTGTYNTSANTLDVTGLPNTPGTDLTLFDTTQTRVKTGKSTYYVMARCKSKKKKIVSSETTTFYDGSSQTAVSTQKCKVKPPKK